MGYPVFIKSIDAEKNCIYLAKTGDEYAPGITLRDCVTFDHEVWDQSPASAFVKIRSRASLSPAKITLQDNGNAMVLFDELQRAPAPGQSCVIYTADGTVLGGGFIDRQLL